MDLLKYITIAALLLISIGAQSKVKVPGLFSNNMVIQRDMPIKIWGWANPNEQIIVEFAGQQSQTITSEKGEWYVILEAISAGGPFQLVIKGEDEISFENVLIGDVWLCSGQSNMFWSVVQSDNSINEINQANYDKIRLLSVNQDYGNLKKQDIITEQWKVCNSENVVNFSAVAYFFGRDIFKDTNVPIGLIHSSWGGSIIEAWMSAESLSEFEEFKDEMAEIGKDSLYLEHKQELYKKNETAAWEAAFLNLEPGLNNKFELDTTFISHFIEQIELPAYWEDNGMLDYDGSVWFKKQIVLPDEFLGQDLWLNLGRIDDYDYTYVNRQKVGDSKYKGIVRKYKISKDLVEEGKVEILVCVLDNEIKGGFWGSEGMYLSIVGKDNNLRYSLEGDWQYKKGFEKTAENLHGSPRLPTPNHIPGYLYNAMIAPLIQYPIKGVIWYQGESNVSNPELYERLFPKMINDWRKDWKIDFPFLYVQLANYGLPNNFPENTNLAQLRNAQLKTLNVPNTAMVTTIDIGKALDIHPTNKQDVGARLALAAGKLAYGKDVVYSGPQYHSKETIGDSIIVSFIHIGQGLSTSNKYGYVNGFSVAGDNGEFYWAYAFIRNNKIIVFSKEVKRPKHVRYGWADNPGDLNLYNIDRLPAVPFSSEE
jgi:sialate O-acetylesterase